MLRDTQTHDLPDNPAEFDRLAAFMGRDTDDLRADLTARLTEVHELIEEFFAQDDGDEAGPDVVPGTLDADVIARWPGYPALRSSRAVEIFKRLRPDILDRLSRTAEPNEALLAFDGFLAGLPAGVQVFSLFEANPQLIDLLVDIVGTAPVLAQYLARNADVFDAVIAGDFFADWPGRGAGIGACRPAGVRGRLRTRARRGPPLAQGMAFPRRRASSARADRRGPGRRAIRRSRRLR